jgi:hypothetical protein
LAQRGSQPRQQARRHVRRMREVQTAATRLDVAMCQGVGLRPQRQCLQSCDEHAVVAAVGVVGEQQCLQWARAMRETRRRKVCVHHFI